MNLPQAQPREVRQQSGHQENADIGGQGGAGCAPARPFSGEEVLTPHGKGTVVSEEGGCIEVRLWSGQVVYVDEEEVQR